MYKTQMSVGIGIIVIGSILILIKVWTGIEYEMAYNACIHNAYLVTHYSVPCQNFFDYISSQIRYVIEFMGIIPIGVVILYCGIKSISLFPRFRGSN